MTLLSLASPLKQSKHISLLPHWYHPGLSHHVCSLDYSRQLPNRSPWFHPYFPSVCTQQSRQNNPTKNKVKPRIFLLLKTLFLTTACKALCNPPHVITVTSSPSTYSTPAALASLCSEMHQARSCPVLCTCCFLFWSHFSHMAASLRFSGLLDEALSGYNIHIINTHTHTLFPFLLFFFFLKWRNSLCYCITLTTI